MNSDKCVCVSLAAYSDLPSSTSLIQTGVLHAAWAVMTVSTDFVYRCKVKKTPKNPEMRACECVCMHASAHVPAWLRECVWNPYNCQMQSSANSHQNSLEALTVLTLPVVPICIYSSQIRPSLCLPLHTLSLSLLSKGSRPKCKRFINTTQLWGTHEKDRYKINT